MCKRFVILKIPGVHPDLLPALHQTLRSSDNCEMTTNGIVMWWRAELLSCKLDNDYETYTAELKIYLNRHYPVPIGGMVSEVTSRTIVALIFEALQILPYREEAT